MQLVFCSHFVIAYLHTVSQGLGTYDYIMKQRAEEEEEEEESSRPEPPSREGKGCCSHKRVIYPFFFNHFNHKELTIV